MERTVLKKKVKKARRRVSLGSLLLLAITFASTSYAWFLYSTKVSTGVTAYIRAWKVSFEVGQEEIEQEINFEVSQIYPGMSTYTDSVVVHNNGESNAAISYEIIGARVLNSGYYVTDVYTSDMLRYTLINDFPFSINITQSNPTVAAGSTESFSLVVSWPFESGNDAADTLWGESAYDYKIAHPNDPSIVVQIRITAVQSNSPTPSPNPEPEPEPEP